MADTGKKLVFILGSYWEQCQGGAELQAHYLALEAQRQRWCTHYIFLSNNDKYRNDTKTILYPIIKKNLWNKLGNIKYPYAGNLLRALNRLKPDVIYQRSGMAFTGIAAYYAQKNNCRFIFHAAKEDDVQPVAVPWKRFYLIPEFKLMQYGIRKAGIIIAQTQMQAKKIAENYGKTAMVIPNGHPVPKDCKKSRAEIIILWIGNWKPVKQPEIFVKLAEKIGFMGKLHFIMVGRKNNYDELVVKARRNNIEVMGEIPNDKVNELLENAHILVNTSKHEGFSNTFIQAWMRRVPVISLNADPDAILKRKEIGYCSGSFIKLVQDTERLISDNAERENMGARAREYAIKNYSWDNMDKILKILAN
jgi:glycosyltransferase involved in cell wall biosynthesis